VGGEAGLFESVPEPDRRRLLAAALRRRFRRREVIFHEGDPGDSVFVIERGRVAIRVTTPLGDVATLTVLVPGDSFGEGALVGPEARRTATAVALEATETRTLTRAQFDALRAEFPAVDRFLVEVLAAQVRRLSGRLLEALYVPAEARVLRRVLDLVDSYGAGPGEVTITVTQEDLATMAGTTRPTVNRFLRSAEERGHLRLERGRIVVVDPDSLRHRA
jgi:CRP/FNR family cyclic AMP-dependent transcriptional regulator